MQYETLVTIVTMLKESSRSVTFDLAARAEYRDPERMERTVYISPLKFSTTADALKKLFYSKKCGAIKSVTLENHRKRLSMAKAKYALVEFAHLDSVEVKRREERDSTPNLYLVHQNGIQNLGCIHCIKSSVGWMMNISANGHNRASKTMPVLDFSLHKHFPVVRIR